MTRTDLQDESQGRIVNWFSCGAASAVSTKLSLDLLKRAGSKRECTIVYCEIKEEHPDNMRFLRDCEKWYDQEIIILGNDTYNRSIYDVFQKTRYLVGVHGARCTSELKRRVRIDNYQRDNDTLVMGYTSEEQNRVSQFLNTEANFPNRDATAKEPLWFILGKQGVTKQDCFAMIKDAGIELPEMYKLGYRNNNCIGCVKGGMGYWNKIRVDFPDTFARMMKMEEEIGHTVCSIESRVNGKRITQGIPLSELSPGRGRYKAEDISCGVFCRLPGDKNDH